MGPTWAAAPGLCDRRRSWRAAPFLSRRVVAWGLAVPARFPSVARMSRPPVPSGGRLGGVLSEGAQDAISTHLGRAGSRAHDAAGRGALPDPRPRWPVLCSAGGLLAGPWRPGRPAPWMPGRAPVWGGLDTRPRAARADSAREAGPGLLSAPGSLQWSVAATRAPPRERVPRRQRSCPVHP